LLRLRQNYAQMNEPEAKIMTVVAGGGGSVGIPDHR
jgi:hypothetical protein